ncbi:MAG: PHP domain-containing protein [Oscillatoria sp. SIO1A7]|nr:PHP domain-containing protein [Oscillatoria sp. SIO1A7]
MILSIADSSASFYNATEEKYALKEVFETIDENSCPLSFNFHMHTVHSDGQLEPEILLKQAIDIGLKGMAITDHHTIGGYAIVRRLLDSWEGNLQESQSQGKLYTFYPQAHQRNSQNNSQNNVKIPRLWTGVEITAEIIGIKVHILGYAFDPEATSMQPYLQGKEPVGSDYQAIRVISAIQEAAGLAVLAHPERYRRSAEKLIPEAAHLGIDGVETYYAYQNPKPWSPSPKQTKTVRKLAETYGLLQTCGTDTHGSNLLLRR